MVPAQLGIESCACEAGQHEPRLVAITGGPGAGKTAVLEMASRSFCSHVGILPESAGIVFGGGFPRHATPWGRRAAQRAIFHVQRELESMVLEEGQLALALCDRGTLDGVAYWPDDPETFWSSLGTTLEHELSRYWAVIHLETPSPREGYNHQNHLRIESAREAKILDGRISEVWKNHPNRYVVPASADFFQKASTALGYIRSEVPRCCRS
ncbi:MAG: ATP-binding protein [Myxococcales bacterium]|nr:ATP-binding protein [Myxococcales bacterium]